MGERKRERDMNEWKIFHSQQERKKDERERDEEKKKRVENETIRARENETHLQCDQIWRNFAALAKS